MAKNAPDSVATGTSGVLVGGKVVIRMGDKVVGFAQSARCTDQYRHLPIHIVGQLQAVEYVPTMSMHEIVLTMMVMRNDSLTRRNIEPWGAGSWGAIPSDNIGELPSREKVSFSTPQDLTKEGKQTGGGQLTVLDNKKITIGITDLMSGKNIVQYDGCFYASGALTISANQIIGHQVTFYSIKKLGQLDAGGDSGLPDAYQTASYAE